MKHQLKIRQQNRCIRVVVNYWIEIIYYHLEIELIGMFRRQQQLFDLVKQKGEAETGVQFPRFLPTKQDSELTFEIEAEREYLNRLKIQRQKIQILYDKYDSLLQQMKNKDMKISDQLRIIDTLETKVKNFESLTPEIQCLRRQTKEFTLENEELRRQMGKIQTSYNDLLTEVKLKRNVNEEEKEEIEDMNKLLVTKIKIVQQKLQEKDVQHEKEKGSWNMKMEELKRSLANEKNQNSRQISSYNEEFLKLSEDIEILQNEIRRLNDQLVAERQQSDEILLEQEEKFNKMLNENRNRIKSYKEQIQSLKYSNDILQDKIKELNRKAEEANKENTDLQNLLVDEKRINEQKIYSVKFYTSQEKTLLREHNFQIESKVGKLEKQLGDYMRREKELVNSLKNYEEKQKIKKNLREIEKSELERINRLLIFEK